MTRKDYELIAATARATLARTRDPVHRDAMFTLLIAFVRVFKHENAGFDSAKFMASIRGPEATSTEKREA